MNRNIKIKIEDNSINIYDNDKEVVSVVGISGKLEEAFRQASTMFSDYETRREERLERRKDIDIKRFFDDNAKLVISPIYEKRVVDYITLSSDCPALEAYKYVDVTDERIQRFKKLYPEIKCEKD